MKPKQLEIFLELAIKNKMPILIKGAPGVGKTDILKSVCKKLNQKLIIEHPVVSDPTDYKGLPFADHKNDIAHFLPFGNLKELIDAKKDTIFFMDDLGQAPPTVQAACMQLLLVRRINGHCVSNKVTFMAATNRQSDRAGVTGMLEPVKSRFASIVNLEPDLDDWIEWADDNNIPVELIAFLKFRPELLHKFEPTSDLINTPSPRTNHNVAKLMNINLSQEMEYEAYSGAAGEGYAAEFIGFLQMYRELPSIEAILKNPKGISVGENQAVLYAVTSALARKADKKNFNKIIEFSTTIPKEFSVILIKESIKLNPEVQKTPAYVKWITENSQVLL